MQVPSPNVQRAGTYSRTFPPLSARVAGVPRRPPKRPCRRYLQVNKEPSREIFYSFVESEDNPDQDPLLVWLQG